MSTDPRQWIAALRENHERLASLIQSLGADQASARSYCSDWTIAQVMSHLGSGAEIAMMMLPVALGEGEPGGVEAFQPVWDAWNAKSPDAQVADGLAADEAQVRQLEQLSDERLAEIRMPFFGLDLDAVGLIRLRLSEHALHTWDVEVALDPAAVVPPDSVALLIDIVPQFLAPRLGKPQEKPLRVRIRTTGPDRDYLLVAAEAVSMADLQADSGPADAAAAAEVSMPAEALLRLAYGRLDPAHTPADVIAAPADLDRLRAMFPGFSEGGQGKLRGVGGAAPGQRDAGAAVPVVVHDGPPARQPLGLQPDLLPYRPQADPVRQDFGAAQPGIDRRAVAQDPAGRGRIGFQPPVAAVFGAAEHDGVTVRKDIAKVRRFIAEPDKEFRDARICCYHHLPAHRHQFRI